MTPSCGAIRDRTHERISTDHRRAAAGAVRHCRGGDRAEISERGGQARGRFKVEAPATTGHPTFDRLFRAQQNMLEQTVLFLPLLALAAVTFGDRVAGIYGLVWSAGRLLYIVTYARGTSSRAPGFLLSAGVSAGMLVAVVVGRLVG